MDPTVEPGDQTPPPNPNQPPAEPAAARGLNSEVEASPATPAPARPTGAGSRLQLGSDSSAALVYPGLLPQQQPSPDRAAPPASRGRFAVARWIALGLLVTLAGGVAGSYSAWRASDRLAAGLVIQGEPVGGLSREQAMHLLRRAFASTPVTLRTGDGFIETLPLNRLGGELQVDGVVQGAYRYGRSGNVPADIWKVSLGRAAAPWVPLPLRWREPLLRRAVHRFALRYDRPARDARLALTGSGMVVLPDQSGRAIDIEATLKAIHTSYLLGTPGVLVPTVEVPARVPAAELASGVDVKIGQYTTRFNSGEEGRTHNVHVAAAAINGKIVPAGQLFSFNRTTGERTSDKGYRVAKIFEKKPGDLKSQIVDGLAGGTCQVSSTLYNTLLKATGPNGEHLRVVQRDPHSLPVTYVPKGRDATVAWPDKDLKFRNTLQYPVYIRTAIKGEHLTVALWSRLPPGLAAGEMARATAAQIKPRHHRHPVATTAP